MRSFEPSLRLCDNCGKDLHNVIVQHGQTFYCKTTDKVYCSKDCINGCKPSKKVINYLYSEIVAKQYLWDLGLEPDKCRETGYPDFKCKGNIWVEIKTPNTGLNKNQIKMFSRLLKKNNRIFILYVHDKKFTFFELKKR